MLASTIRDAVRQCAETLLHNDRLGDEETASRQHAIVVECDLGGTPRSLLAAKLGVSARQYTRLQHDVRRRIAIQISSGLRGAQRARTAACVPVPSPLDAIAMLAARGSTEPAVAQLSAIVAAGGDDRLLASALCLLSSIRHRYAGDVSGASEALAESRSVVERLAPDDPSRSRIEAEIDMGSVEIDVSAGQFTRATQRSAAVAQTLERTGDSARWLRLRALAWAAYGGFVLGKRDEALRCLNDVLSDFSAAATAPIPDRVELSLSAAVVLAELGRLAESSRVLAEGWFVAKQNGLNADAIRLDLLQAMIGMECGAVAAATQRLGEICDESRQLAAGSLCAQAHAYLARAQMRSPQPRPNDILANARRVLELTPNEYAAWTDAKIAESFARLMLRDVAGAESAARAADDAAVTMGHRLYRGSTLRELARVAYVQGRQRDAKRAIIGAVEVSYSIGKPQQAAEALELAAQILQQPNYRQEASVLRHAFPLSGTLSPFGSVSAG
jgi:tetratricopeptide (TPR) repeat protein